MSKQRSRIQQPSTASSAPSASFTMLDGLGNAARAEMLGLERRTRDVPGTEHGGIDIATWLWEGFEEEPLATTTSGHTMLDSGAASHPERATIEAHEQVHRQQHERHQQGAPNASREALETEAQQGSKALVAGQDFEATLGAASGMALAYTPDEDPITEPGTEVVDHSVEEDEWLYKIAREVYGSEDIEERVREIYDLNGSVIGSDRDLIRPGQVLKLPDVPAKEKGVPPTSKPEVLPPEIEALLAGYVATLQEITTKESELTQAGQGRTNRAEFMKSWETLGMLGLLSPSSWTIPWVENAMEIVGNGLDGKEDSATAKAGRTLVMSPVLAAGIVFVNGWGTLADLVQVSVESARPGTLNTNYVSDDEFAAMGEESNELAGQAIRDGEVLRQKLEELRQRHNMTGSEVDALFTNAVTGLMSK